MTEQSRSGTVDPHAPDNPVYEQGYATEWLWDFTRPTARVREWWKLKHHIVDRLGLRPGSRVLEIACGQGYHVNALRRMGHRVTGVDISQAGIDFAKRHFPDDDFMRIDAALPMPFDDQSFDLVWSHGAGFFHYCITDDATAEIVGAHVRLIKPGGHYLVMIASDLSGARPGPHEEPWASEWQHTFVDLRTMLGRHAGDVSVDWFPTRRWVIGPSIGSGYAVGVLRIPK